SSPGVHRHFSTPKFDKEPLFMNETQMSLFIIMAEHAIAVIQGGSFRDGVHTFKEKAKFTAGKGHDFLQS
ncbi:hypothetical protein, partial [Acidaminococcus intestini]